MKQRIPYIAFLLLCIILTLSHAHASDFVFNGYCKEKNTNTETYITVKFPISALPNAGPFYLVQVDNQAKINDELLDAIKKRININYICREFLIVQEQSGKNTEDNIAIGSTIAKVYFRNDQSKLTNASISILDNLVKLTSSSKKKFTVIGHTDNIGSVEYNDKLGKKRAESVTSYLKSKGMVKVNSLSKGESVPLESNTTLLGRSKNRRVEILVN
ncbi:OmpA family protein [Vibrio sp. ED004]|uniref:OmpA family protein n=1 Tax=Vibrio sp. ED004 TaxID=2785124 RepID=UPI00207033EF|nr:OmpA family protein [Vibrio sp. ED004]UPR58175.1 OmpA family protein [Vibrio sp. ED004]